MYLITVLIILFIVWFGWHMIRYRNPYKLYMVFGRKGSGKTTLSMKLALKWQKKKKPVYSNMDLPGCYKVNTDDIGRVMFPPDSLLLIDEVGLVWDSRNFKNFPDHVKQFFKYQRHYRVTCYLFSQSFDVDKKLRDLTDHIYLVQNFMNCLSIARRVTKHITIVHADKSAQGESKIVDDYTIDPIFCAPFGGIRITYIPKYAKFFKSFDPPLLPDQEFALVPFPDKFRRKQNGRIARRRERLEFINMINRRRPVLDNPDSEECV